MDQVISQSLSSHLIGNLIDIVFQYLKTVDMFAVTEQGIVNINTVTLKSRLLFKDQLVTDLFYYGGDKLYFVKNNKVIEFGYYDLNSGMVVSLHKENNGAGFNIAFSKGKVFLYLSDYLLVCDNGVITHNIMLGSHSFQMVIYKDQLYLFGKGYYSNHQIYDLTDLKNIRLIKTDRIAGIFQQIDQDKFYFSDDDYPNGYTVYNDQLSNRIGTVRRSGFDFLGLFSHNGIIYVKAIEKYNRVKYQIQKYDSETLQFLGILAEPAVIFKFGLINDDLYYRTYRGITFINLLDGQVRNMNLQLKGEDRSDIASF